MPTTIESLELEVQSSSTSASKGIDALSASLSKLKNAVKGGVGLTSVANQVRNLNTALQSVDGSSIDKIDKLVNSLSKLKNLGSVKISSSIGNQLKNIGSAASSLNGADFSGIGKLSSAIQPLSAIGKASGLQSTITQLQKLPQLAHTLNSVNWSTLTSQLQQLSNALAPLANQLNTVSNAFTRLPTNIRRVVTATNAIPQANNRAANSYINLWAKLNMAINAVRTGARIIASWITESNSYIENLNLFSVSMGEHAEEAQKYAEAVGELMGIDPGAWMRNQGVFNTIISGFGVASDQAYLMSKNLTQLGYDLSSFFNISYEDAFQKLQSGISGELEPLRRLGYDLSVARLQQEALNLGIEKSVMEMTQAEKSQLRYYAIMTQVTVAQGDMARTLNAPANQLRVLQAQVTQCARALGNIFIPALNAVLPYAIALAKILRILASAIASFFGFELPEVDYSGISAGASAVGDLADGAGSAADGLGDATEAAKKLKNAMLGIDELNIISPNDSSSGSGGAGSGVGVGGSDLGIDLPEYDFLGNAVASKVDEIVEKMKEWLGLTDEINSWSDFLHTRLGHILTTVGSIALGLAAWKISKGVLDALRWINELKGYGLTNPLTIAIGISLLVTGIALEWSGIIDAILNELDLENFAQIISGGILTVGGGSLLGKGIAGWITTAFADSAVAKALATAATNLGLGSATAAGAAIGAGIAAIIAGVPAYFVGIYDAIKNGLNWLNGLLIPAGSTAAAAGIGAIIGACGGPIGAGIGALIGLAVGLITDGIILITEHWDEITSFLKNFFTVTIPNLWNSFVGWLKNLPSEISQWFTDLWQPIKDFDWYGLGHDVGTWFGNALKSGIDFVTVKIPNWFSNLLTTITTSVKTFFTETLPKFFTETIPKTIEKIAEWFKGLPEAIWNAVQSGWEWLVDVGKSIIDGIVEGFKSIGKAIGDFVSGFVDGVKEALGIHSPSTVFIEIGEMCIEGLLNGLVGALKGIGKWVKKNIIDPIGEAIEDNPITDMVVEIKNTASEWWEKAKEWWSDATKDGLSIETAVELVKKGWTSVKSWIGNVPVIGQAISLIKSGWSTVKEWVGNIPIVQQGIELIKEGWSTVKNWVGNIPTLSQAISLVKTGWNTVKEWIGNIPTLSQAISLIKSGWSTIKNWIGDIPVLSQAINLIKSGWTTVKNWIGNIPTLSQAISLVKSGWTTIKGWIGYIPTLSQAISLIKSGWTTVKNWIGYIPTISQGISLIKSGWSSVKSWIGNLPVIGQGISLFKSGWYSISSFVGTSVSVGVSLFRSGWSSLSSWIGNKVSVGISLFKSGWSSIKSFFGLSSGGYNTGHGFQMFSGGGYINAKGNSGFWKSIPMYANGTANAGLHGSMFVAGENGAEMVGHINGQTEVLNRSQIAQAMKSAVVAGMSQFTGYWRTINSQMVVCSNAIIRSILVSSDVMNASLATVGGSYDPTNALAQSVYEDSQRAYNNSYSEESLSRAMREFYQEYVEPTLKEIASDTKRQADKEEQTIVQVGNRTISDAVVTQQKANGYSFTK